MAIRGANSDTRATDVAVAPTSWQSATVTRIERETARAKSFTLRLDEPVPHRAGQHYIVRLRAPDGYTASRSYSVASAPDRSGEIQLTVERLHDGEVSTFLHDVVEVGDELEVRGPIGNWFAWDGDDSVLLVAGGSGVVPLMSMLRHARQIGRPQLVQLVVSVRSADDLYYAAEIVGPQTTVVHTRVTPPGAVRPARRLAREDLAARIPGVARAFVCGSAGFADHVTDLLVAEDMDADAIRVERFGPTATP